MVGKPGSYILIFVVRSIVLNVIHATAVIGSGHCVEEYKIGFRIEDLVSMIEKPGREDIYTTEDLYALPLARDRNQRLMSPPCPCQMKRRILPERGFILKN